MVSIRFVNCFAALLAGLFSPLLTAQQFVPDSDDFVVETLPGSIVALSRELEDYRAQASTRRDSLTLSATQLSLIEQKALAAYQIAAASQEQRAYGHTLAVLERWPEEQEKSAIIHILMAAVLQHDHNFNAALFHLDAALGKEPASAQAWLMRAQINLVTADYDTARDSCKVLSTLVRRAVGVNCLAQVDALTGNAQQSLSSVESMLTENRDLSRLDYTELFTSAAGFAQRLGKIEDATRYYNAAWQLAPEQPYVLVHYAQLLLDQSRYEDVIALFSPHLERALSDEQKILYARALAMSGERQYLDRAKAIKENLDETFSAAFKRAEALPNKVYAQYALYLSNEPEKALAAARANWELQKEPSDTLLLALAAQANDAQTEMAVLARWLDTHRTEDVRLDRVFASHGVTQ
jgi:predicted Zn-dependent protease